MTETKNIGRDITIFIAGLSLIFLSQIPLLQSLPAWCKMIETIGIGMAGYGSINILIPLTEMFGRRATRKSIDRLFHTNVKIVSPKKEYPAFIAADIEGCITPPNRAQIDLRRFQGQKGDATLFP